MKTDVSLKTAAPPPAAPAGRGTRIRFRVAALGTALAMVTYLDRVSMGTIAPIVTREWHLTPSQTGWIFSAFALAYALIEIPTAKWAETLGPDPDRRVVVGVHRRDRAGLLPAVDAARPLPLRGRRGGRVADGGAGIFELDSPVGTRHGPGHLLRRRSSRGWPHPAAH